MQVTTSTTTTETIKVEGANFRITTFEESVTAFCDLCPNQATGTKTALETQGWFMGNREQFCPACN